MGVAFIYLCCDNNQIVKSNRKWSESQTKSEGLINGQEVINNHY